MHPVTHSPAPLIAEDVHAIIQENKATLDSAIVYDRDFSYDYFGFKTLERAYLLKMNGKIVERPQQMIMRVAVGIHKNNIERVLETYDLMSVCSSHMLHQLCSTLAHHAPSWLPASS